MEYLQLINNNQIELDNTIQDIWEILRILLNEKPL